MARKKEDKNSSDTPSDKEPEKEAEDNHGQDFQANMMNLMKDWYSHSSEMLNFMLNSFSTPFGKNPIGTDKSSSDGNDKRETIWNGYIENMEKLIKEMTVAYGFNQERMEALYNSWKEFQNTVSSYFNIGEQSDSNLNVPPEVWTKWFEYADVMNRQFVECFYDRESQANIGQPYKTFSGSTIRTGIPCDNISQLDEQSLNEMNEIIGNYYAELTRDLMAANEAVMLKNESAAEKSQEFLDKWTGQYDDLMKKLIRTRAFNVILNDNLKANLDAKKQLDDAFEEQWKLLGLPTRNDVMELHRTLHDLQLKLNRLHKDFKEFNNHMNSK